MFRIECSSPNTLNLIGELDGFSDRRLRTALDAFTGPVELDLTELEFIDSTALRVVAERLATGPVRLVQPPLGVLRLLDLCGLREMPGLTIEAG